ncbi:MAG TPA: transporter substrate-binding domain-containing protein [Casimicrobiaceae bacterium]|jgi:polar amino acid transport system substrate-binding protein
MKYIRLAILLPAIVSACASNLPQPSAEAAAELTLTGKLRVGLHLSDQFLVARDSGTGQFVGIAADLGRLLSDRLGRAFEPVPYANSLALTASVGTGEWDIAFLATDPALRTKADFSRPYVEVDYGYLVRANNARLRTTSDVDQETVRIAVPVPGNAYDLLAGTIKRAQIVPVRGGKIALAEAMSSGAVDVYAESVAVLAAAVANVAEYRLLEGRFAAAEYVILVPRGKPEALKYVNAFIDSASASGEIENAIKRAGLNHVRVPTLDSKLRTN